MKETYPEIPNILPKSQIFDEIQLKNNLNYNEEACANNAENELNSKFPKDQETLFINKYKKLCNGDYRTEDFLKLSKKEQIEWLHAYIKSEEDGTKLNFKNLPDNLLHLNIATLFEGDSGNSPEKKPDWLDLEKFKRGQKFATDYSFGLAYAELLSLFILFSFEEGLKPLILTGKSSTPYTAFKRYLSTAVRLKNWFTDDPWTEGTAAYKDIITVRNMHNAVRKRLKEISYAETEAAAKIKNPFSKTRNILLEDFRSCCPAPTTGQCPYKFNGRPELRDVVPKGINQGEMVATQFGFVGLMILYPKYFGVHNASSEDLEAFCHTWQGIGYLLGIDDEFNLCRGTLTEIKQRCKDFLEFWAIPNFRDLTPECEHMMRCVVEGNKYFLPGSSYETSICYLSEMLNLHTPRLYSTLSYRSWIKYNLLKFYFQYTCQVPQIMTLMNKKLDLAINKAVEFSAEKHEELKKRSEETLEKAINNL